MSYKVTLQNLVRLFTGGADFNNLGFDMDFNVTPVNLDFLIENESQ